MLNQPKTINQVGKKVGDYKFIKFLGMGSFAEVFEAYNENDSSKRVAIKCVQRNKLKEHNGLVGELLRTEIDILRKCNNPNVIKLYDYLESANQCYLILEYCNGDFEKIWKQKNRTFNENEAVSYLKQILNGIKGLHELRVIHRDLKIPNLLIHDGVIKIADLGFAKQLDFQEQRVQLTLGSLGCMAPEVVEGLPYGIQADMWSLGSIFYQMLFGDFPFSVQGYKEFLNDIKMRKTPNYDIRNIRISQEAKNLLTNMLQIDPTRRIKWVTIYDHKLIKDKIGANNEMQIHNLKSQMVDPRANRQVYEQDRQLENLINNKVQDNIVKKQEFRAKIHEDTTTNQNQNQIQNQTQNQYQQEVNFQQSQTIDNDPELIQQIQQVIKYQEEMEKNVMDLLKQYLIKRNFYVFLVRTYDKFQNLNKQNIVFIVYTELMILKKIRLDAKQLVEVIGLKQNIFKANQEVFIQLNRTKEMEKLFEIVQEDLSTYNTNIEFQFSEMKQQKDFIKNLNDIQKSELEIEPTNKFEENLKNSIIDYYFEMAKKQEKEQLILIYLLQLNIIFPDELIKQLQQDNQYNFDLELNRLQRFTIQQLQVLINETMDNL